MTWIQENLTVLLSSLTLMENHFFKSLLNTDYMQWTIRETIMNRKNLFLHEPYSLVQKSYEYTKNVKMAEYGKCLTNKNTYLK